MTTYVDVALEEIREDYPKAYDILKDALPRKFIPVIEERTIGADGIECKSSITDKSGLLTLQASDIGSFEVSEEGYATGSLKIGANHYKLHNCVLVERDKHQLDFCIERVEEL